MRVNKKTIAGGKLGEKPPAKSFFIHFIKLHKNGWHQLEN
jgi:hypothetical protein